MFKRLLHLSFVLSAWGLLALQTEPPTVVEILSPAPGQALQGVVLVQGTAAGEGFQFATLSFSYSQDPTGSWFEVTRIAVPVRGGNLALWDTTALTDGDYALRLTLFYDSGEPQSQVTTGLRVRNYSAIETDTPAPTFTARPDVTASPTPSPRPTASRLTPTPLPTNPAQITTDRLAGSLLQGALVALAGFAGLGLLLWVRTGMRR